MLTFLIPKASIKRESRSIGGFRYSLSLIRVLIFKQPSREKLKRVVPERIDFDRFSATWGDNPIIHLGIHPSECIALCSLRKQPILRVNANTEDCSPHMALVDIKKLRQCHLQYRSIATRLRIPVQCVEEP